MDPSVHVDLLRRVFKVPVRQPGLKESVKALFRREHREVVAVDGVSFDLRAGEVVGFLGPNGAGKTTTLKMLSGLLYPDSGTVEVLGHVPHKRERAYLKRMALVMGNRTSLTWDLPPLDSYLLLRTIYEIPHADFERRRDAYIELLELEDLVTKPVRNLSLGERMKVELAAALLHKPDVIFLDEPTIGLDLTMQRRLRQFVLDYNRENGATVLLTSHYMADVVAMAERVIVIDHGRILYDGDLAGLAAGFGGEKTITIHAEGMPDDLGAFGAVVDRSPARVTLRVANAEASQVAARLLNEYDVTDVTIEDPPIEDVIERVFASGDDEA
jgi:ABC-2 type transport system ATP-binding protein